jgi:hypothetical protein
MNVLWPQENHVMLPSTAALFKSNNAQVKRYKQEYGTARQEGKESS